MAQSLTPRKYQKRQNSSLFSYTYKAQGLPIRHLVLDECQAIKNEQSLTHKAIKSLHYSTLAALSGNFIANKWYDLFSLVSVMPGGNPFEKRGHYHRVFAKPVNRFSDPTPTRINRLVKYLTGFTVARPSINLRLPGLTVEWYGFNLETKDTLVRFWLLEVFTGGSCFTSPTRMTCFLSVMFREQHRMAPGLEQPSSLLF